MVEWGQGIVFGKYLILDWLYLLDNKNGRLRPFASFSKRINMFTQDFGYVCNLFNTNLCILCLVEDSTTSVWTCNVTHEARLE